MCPTPTPPISAWTTLRSGYEAGSLLAQHALRKWKGKVDWVLGVGFTEAGSFVQSRITGAFDGIRERLKDLPRTSLCRSKAAACASPASMAVSGVSCAAIARASASWWPPPPTPAPWAFWMRRAQTGREEDFAIVGQDCIPEVLEEMRTGKSAIIGSISHEAESYGPRLIQLGIALLRGYTVPPYNYVRHRAVTPESSWRAEEREDSADCTGDLATPWLTRPVSMLRILD